MAQTNWRPVQLPRNLVDKAEKLTKKSHSNYRNVSDFISTIICEKLDKLETTNENHKTEVEA